MTTALLVPFFRYDFFRSQRYKTISEMFFRLVGNFSDLIDHVYIGDGGWGLTRHINTQVTIVDTKGLSHPEAMGKLVQATTEDFLIIIDQDTLIYDKKPIMAIEQALDNGKDITAILDNSGKEALWEANEFRAQRKRIAPYLFAVRRKTLFNTCMDFGFDGDSNTKVSKDLVNSNLLELEDDRNTVHINGGEFQRDTWLDGPAYLWSLPLDKQKELGYYHLRNWGLSISLLDDQKYDPESYKKRIQITPVNEALRIHARQWILEEKTSHYSPEEFYKVVADYNVSWKLWKSYIEEYKNYYPWIEKL